MGLWLAMVSMSVAVCLWGMVSTLVEAYLWGLVCWSGTVYQLAWPYPSVLVYWLAEVYWLERVERACSSAVV